MNCTTTYAWVAQTTARPRSSRAMGGFGHAPVAVMTANAGWLLNPQFMATIKRPARHLGKLPT